MSFYIIKGDIFKQEVDAIVLTSATSLPIRGILWKQIKEQCGEEAVDYVRKELAQLRNPSLTQCVITNAYNLPCKRFIHAVTPRWHGGTKAEKEEQIDYLADTYDNCIDMVEDFGLNSVAFPLLSAGAYHFPKDIAINTAIEVLSERAKKNEDLDIALVIYSQDTWNECSDLMKDYTIEGGELHPDVEEQLNEFRQYFNDSREYRKGDDEELVKTEDELQTIGEKLRHVLKVKNKTQFDCYNGIIGKTAFGNIVSPSSSKRKKSVPGKYTLVALGLNIDLNEQEINDLLSPLGEWLNYRTNKKDQIILANMRKYDKEKKTSDWLTGFDCIEWINKDLTKIGGIPLKFDRQQKNKKM